jgi:hypothetical protein
MMIVYLGLALGLILIIGAAISVVVYALLSNN